MALLRIVTLLVWMAVGAGAVGWWLAGAALMRVSDHPVPVAPTAVVPPADWASALGPMGADPARAPAPGAMAQASRLRLVGVAGPVRSDARSGVALLSVDGAAARAYRVGQVVDGQWTVLEITAHEVRLGPERGPASLTLQTPLLPPAATGTMAAGATGS